jgi:hypothetical protein
MTNAIKVQKKLIRPRNSEIVPSFAPRRTSGELYAEGKALWNKCSRTSQCGVEART